LGIRDGREDRGMYCTITAGLLLSSVSIASLPCSDFDQTIDFDQIAEVEKPRVAEVEKPKVQLASLDHSYVPLPPSQPKKSEIKIGTTTINLEQSNIKNMSCGQKIETAEILVAATQCNASPWQCLNFIPEPHGHGSLRPGTGALWTGRHSFSCGARRASQ
jgi:hypothetical protein